MTAEPKLYRGEPVGCAWCSYGVMSTDAIATVQPATHVIETDKGPREVCELHAFRGRWERRARRVSRVA